MRPPVYIRGQAVSCALGSTPARIVDRLRRRNCPVGHVDLSRLSPPVRRPLYYLPDNPPRNGPVSGLRSEFCRSLFETADRALQDAGILDRERETMALFLGSTSLDIPIYESICNTTGGGAPGTLTKTTTGYSRMADDLAAHLGTAGPCFTFTTACTSSANALLYATEMIQTGRIRLAMVVGFEALSRLSLYGFESLGLIAGDAAAPFGVRSGGMVLGEGCGALVLDGRSAGRTGFALLGGANRCDPHGVTTHAENGSAMAEVMRDAMASAGVNREEITAVKVHATGNVANDRAEFKGLKTVFGAEIPPLTGLKPYVGHTLGACGAVEMIVLAEAVADGFIPASPRDPPADQKVPAFLTDHIIAVGQGAFLINHFGFGGSCTAFITANGK